MRWRKWHRDVGLIVALPLLAVALTGSLLILRNQFEWIQPKAVAPEYQAHTPLLTLEQIEGKIGNREIDQIIYRPKKKNLSVRLKDSTEIQLHPQTGVVLKEAKRRTNLFIEIHQGSWLGGLGMYAIHLPAALGFIFLIVSGILIYPFKKKKNI